ncbi:polysaccharide deacetylase family protein [Nocardia jiangxiensis]|uniref:Polysaccharide deacetylase family protein n=1 Tax=Nocardia jiangxiensis TaxID=282685 RepID=A0ABW6S0E1_9NOCA
MFDRVISRRGLLVAGAMTAAGLASAACAEAWGSSPTSAVTRQQLPVTAAQDPAAMFAATTNTPAAAPANAPAAQSASGVQPTAVAAAHTGQRPAAWAMAMPGIITTFVPAGRQMALTFDACGGPGNDEMNEVLMNFLISQRIPATLFLNERWIDADPARAESLANNPLFEIGNHGTRHCPLSVTGRSVYNIRGTASPQQAVDEVWGNHERLIRLTGRAPRFFRTGTAHYDDIAVKIVHKLGETPVGFSINADAGATFGSAQIQREMAAAVPGAISIAHMHRPKSGTAPGMLAAIPRLRSAGYEFVHLP